MSDQSKIFNLYENNLNQSAIGADQQRNPNGNLKYRPGDAAPGQSYARYSIPTTSSAKVKGSPFVPNGISDEEMVIKGYGVIDSGQAVKFLERLKNDIHDLIDKNVTGAILKSKIDLYSSIIKQMG
tara:strand:+ start:609 stop:986 length:378 start_codon:yes stop_codon:yes gene_type:complete